MIATIGDLAEDVIVTGLPVGAGRGIGGQGPRELQLQLAADTSSIVERRRGGSAANVAAAIVAAGGAARFIGRVGDDHLGLHLVTELRSAGVETIVRYGGRTATVIVIVHADGERSMLTDRGAAVLLDRPEPSWLDGVRHLHLPLYSLAESPLAETARSLIGLAQQRSVPTSIDASAHSLLSALGPAMVRELLEEVRPSVLFANEDEAASSALGPEPERLTTAAFVVKRGPRPARIVPAEGEPFDVPASDLGPVADTTGAGDAFAAGFLVARLGGSYLRGCAQAGHRAAADHLLSLAAG